MIRTSRPPDSSVSLDYFCSLVTFVVASLLLSHVAQFRHIVRTHCLISGTPIVHLDLTGLLTSEHVQCRSAMLSGSRGKYNLIIIAIFGGPMVRCETCEICSPECGRVISRADDQSTCRNSFPVLCA